MIGPGPGSWNRIRKRKEQNMASTMTGRARPEELRKELEGLLNARGEAEKAVGKAKGRLFFSILLLLGH